MSRVSTPTYDELKIQRYIGATPAWPAPHLLLGARRTADAAEMASLLRGTLELWQSAWRKAARTEGRLAAPSDPAAAQADRVAAPADRGIVPPVEVDEAALRKAFEQSGDLIVAWVRVVRQGLGLDASPAAIGQEIEPVNAPSSAPSTAPGSAAPGPVSLSLRVSTLHPEVDAEWLACLASLPGLALARDERRAAAVDRLAARFAALRSRMPSPALIALHRALDAAGIPVHWLPGRGTLIGHGRKRRMIPADRPVTLPIAGLPPPDALSIPVYSVTGSIGKTTTVRMLAQLLAPLVRSLGYTSSDGIWVDGERKVDGDCIGGRSSHAMLSNFPIDAAVLEVGRGGLVRQGFPFCRTDVGVLLNVHEVHLGLDGVASLDAMADVKALSLAPARIAVLNADDSQCWRIGEARAPHRRAWFSRTAPLADVERLSEGARAALGVVREVDGQPRALRICEQGRAVATLSLEGVVPFHGMLGEKSVEELLAAVAAVWVGPIVVPELGARLRNLRLDAGNHLFRSSVHPVGRHLIVLDKAGNPVTMPLLIESIDALARQHGIARRLCVLTRSAADPIAVHEACTAIMYPGFDEFLIFDRPEVYDAPSALPVYTRGSIPTVLRGILERLDAEQGVGKPIATLPEWAEVEARLADRLGSESEPMLVLLNQNSTSAPQLNARIVAFVERLQAQASSAAAP